MEEWVGNEKKERSCINGNLLQCEICFESIRSVECRVRESGSYIHSQRKCTEQQETPTTTTTAQILYRMTILFSGVRLSLSPPFRRSFFWLLIWCGFWFSVCAIELKRKFIRKKKQINYCHQHTYTVSQAIPNRTQYESRKFCNFITASSVFFLRVFFLNIGKEELRRTKNPICLDTINHLADRVTPKPIKSLWLAGAALENQRLQFNSFKWVFLSACLL